MVRVPTHHLMRQVAPESRPVMSFPRVPRKTAAPQPDAHACSQCVLRRAEAFAWHASQAGADRFRHISEAKIAHHTIAAEAVIYEEGGAPKPFTIYQGIAYRYKILKPGRRQILRFLFPGDTMGAHALNTADAQHGVRALTAVEYCEFSPSALQTLATHDASFAIDLARTAAHEAQQLDDIVLTLGRRTAPERVAAFMLNFHGRCVAAGMGKGHRVPFPLTVTHLADAIGLSAIHTSRSLSDLKRRGLFTLSNGWLQLDKPLALAQLARCKPWVNRRRPLI